MVATLLAQFLSALADNALLFAAVALVREKHFPAWSGPLLQELFVGTYILLAPYVGGFSDTRPKSRVMLMANIVKFAGALAMCFKANPFAAYAVVGIGAAVYSPAKYAILGEFVTQDLLVKANGLLEASTIAAIVLGAAAGGALTDWSVPGTLITITICYAAGAASTLAIPHPKPAPRQSAVSKSTSSIAQFAQQIRELVKLPIARLALIGTSLFWGAGAALRFLLIAWVPVALRVTNNRLPAFLTAMVGAGIVVGAALAARFVPIDKVRRALPAGVLIGVGVCLLPLARTTGIAFVVMAWVGIASGFFVVPLDALLQKEAEGRIGVGNAVAVQNLFENLSMLVMVSIYTAVTYLSVPINPVAVAFGLLLAISMALLIRMPRSPPAPNR